MPPGREDVAGADMTAKKKASAFVEAEALRDRVTSRLDGRGVSVVTPP